MRASPSTATRGSCLDAVAQAEASVRSADQTLRGDLRISVPPIFSSALHEILCSFAARYPEVRLQVHFSSQHVDLRREGFDVALRAANELEPGLVARTLRASSLSPSRLRRTSPSAGRRARSAISGSIAASSGSSAGSLRKRRGRS